MFVCVSVSNVNTTQPIDNSYLLLKLSARGGAGHKKTEAFGNVMIYTVNEKRERISYMYDPGKKSTDGRTDDRTVL